MWAALEMAEDRGGGRGSTAEAGWEGGFGQAGSQAAALHLGELQQRG